MAIQATVTIRRPPAEVFRWIEVPDLAARWQVGVIEYQIIHEEPGKVGTTFREVVGDEKGRVELRGEVVGYTPGVAMEFLVSGRGIRVRSRYEVAADPAGTRLDVVADVRIGGVLSPVFAPFTRRRSVRQLRTELAMLADLCEA